MTPTQSHPSSESRHLTSALDENGKSIKKRPSRLRERNLEALLLAIFFTNVFLLTPDLAEELSRQSIMLMPEFWLASDRTAGVPNWLRFIIGTILALNLMALTVSVKWIANTAHIHRALGKLEPDDQTGRRALHWRLWQGRAIKVGYLAITAVTFGMLYPYAEERRDIANALANASPWEPVHNLSIDGIGGEFSMVDQTLISGYSDGFGNTRSAQFGTLFVLVQAWLLHAALLFFPVPNFAHRSVPASLPRSVNSLVEGHPA